VIQFALLFGLGFLTAALLAMLIAPAVHGRIVRYTENRLKATLPISPQEVRSQRDMARAVYAAENAKTKQELVQERDKALATKLRYEKLGDEARRLQSDNHDLQMQINDMDVEAADMRSRLRQEDSYVQQLKAAVEAAEEADAAKGLQLDELQRRLLKLTADVDNLRIDLSARDTEIENLKFRITSLRDEREGIRNDIKLQTIRAKDADARLAQEEHRALRLEDKLGREIAARTDKENALERRIQEIARLKDKLKTVNAAAKGLSRSGKSEEPAARGDVSRATAIATPLETTGAATATIAETIAASAELSALADDVHNRATALSDRLLKTKTDTNDAFIREEMASIAATMVALTAKAEGPTSPVHKILAGKSGTGSNGRESLAARAKNLIDTPAEQAG
jgi:DNA repair exonuclease SbcCD ATPase subunit